MAVFPILTPFEFTGIDIEEELTVIIDAVIDDRAAAQWTLFGFTRHGDQPTFGYRIAILDAIGFSIGPRRSSSLA